MLLPSMPIFQPHYTEPQRLCNHLSQQMADCFVRAIIISSFVACLSNCVVYCHFLWRGRESYWLTCRSQYPPVACPHVFANKNVFPSLHCLGFTLRISVLPRHRNGAPPFYSFTSEVAPELLQFPPYSILTNLPNPFQLLAFRGTFPASCALFRV